jgi:hypothetical protein
MIFAFAFCVEDSSGKPIQKLEMAADSKTKKSDAALSNTQRRQLESDLHGLWRQHCNNVSNDLDYGETIYKRA